MADYILSCCSSVDTSPTHLADRGISYVHFNYEIDGVPYRDDFGQSTSPAELYAKMLAGAEVKTSQVSVGQYVEHFRPLLARGKDVLHVTLSSGISGTYHSACEAARMLAEECPTQRVVVVDSLCASAGYGLLMDRLAELRDAGMSFDDLCAWTSEHRTDVQHWFFSTDLTFFIQGGRISKAAGLIGGLLNICPLMDVDAAGMLQVRERIRTKRKATMAALGKMRQFAEGGSGYAGKVYISQSECYGDARALADLIEEAFPTMEGGVEIFPIGATIGCHTGPGTVALFFWGGPRV